MANTVARRRRGIAGALMTGGFEGTAMRRGDRGQAAARLVASPPARPSIPRGDRGQAAVELVAGLPALLLVAAVVMQLLAVGYTAVLAGDAAEAGALAMARGEAPAMAARSAIPGWARSGMQVTRAVGAVHVRMRPPHLLPWVGDLLRIRASAAVAAPGRAGLLP